MTQKLNNKRKKEKGDIKILDFFFFKYKGES